MLPGHHARDLAIGRRAQSSPLLEVVTKPDDADRDEIDRYHIVEQARHEQDQDSGDQGDQWVDQDWIKVHRFSPQISGQSARFVC